MLSGCNTSAQGAAIAVDFFVVVVVDVVVCYRRLLQWSLLPIVMSFQISLVNEFRGKIDSFNRRGLRLFGAYLRTFHSVDASVVNSTQITDFVSLFFL